MKKQERNKRFNKARREALKRRTKIQKDTWADVLRLLNLGEQNVRMALLHAPSDYQQWILPQLQQSIKQAMADVSEQMAATLSTQANAAWQAGIDLVDVPLAAGGIQVSGVLPQVNVQQLSAIRSFMTDRIKNVSSQTVQRINDRLGLLAMGADSLDGTVSAVEKLLRYSEEEFGSARSRALTIVRTEVGRVYSVAAHERMTQAKAHVPGLKKQWRRSGKLHSRASHDAADGQVQNVEDPFNVGGVELMFPRDPTAPAAETINCGCEQLPYVENWPMSNLGPPA